MRSFLLLIVAGLTLGACSATVSNDWKTGKTPYKYLGYVDVSTDRSRPDHAGSIQCLYRSGFFDEVFVLGTNTGSCYGATVWIDRLNPDSDYRVASGWLPAGKYSYEWQSIAGGISRVPDETQWYDFLVE